jgi:hypothetical protein
LKQSRIHIAWYAAGDFIAALIVWIIFYFVRKIIIAEAPVVGNKFYLGLILYPFAWLVLYHLMGSYNNIYHKSRLNEFLKTFNQSFFGSIIILFLFLLNDVTGDYNIYCF